MIQNFVERAQDKLTRIQNESRRRKIPPPSFYAKMAQRKRLADRVRAVRGVSEGPIYDLETKLGQKKIADKAGVRTAGVLQGPFDSLSEFDLASLPRKFVIKPVVGSGSNGVFLLEKQEDGLKELITGDVFPNQLTSLDAAGLSEFKGVPLIAEDLIEFAGVPSMNWKVFSFFGEVGFIRQGDQSQADKPYKLWSPTGEDLGPIDHLGFRYDSTLPPPKDMVFLLNKAKTISLNVMTPFVRVDLYEADNEVFLGEVTLRPSSLWKKKHYQKFTPEWDRKLGEMWEDAEARLVEKLGESYLP